ncbi:MAG TPA: hypothetical protein VGR61_07360 [Candidatus Dormibacteraeota bacterium]|nr:hypothetical protein [Candidatus Dormibacteraeota bacterium]
MMRGVFGSTALGPPRRRWSRITASGLAAAAGAAWSLGCLIYGAFLFQQYFASRDTVCPPTADFAAFCRANLADDLGASLKRVSMALLVGLVVTGVSAALTSFQAGSRCPSCGARRGLEATACARCGFDPFA